MNRFWDKVKVSGPDECWAWTGHLNRNGRGLFWLEGKNKTAYRVAYELAKGKIPDGMHVLHRCDNPSCVNPSHLFLGTPTDNQQDSINKGRKAIFKGEHNPRCKLTDEQVAQARSDGRSIHKIAEELGVSFQHIGSIKQNLSRKIQEK